MKHTVNKKIGKKFTNEGAKTGYGDVMKALENMEGRKTSEGELDNFLREIATGDEFTDAVNNFLGEKNVEPPQVYKQGNLSRQYFSDITSGRISVKKSVVFNVAIGLNLDCRETIELLNSAGYSCNFKKQFDSIIMYHIAHRDYDIYKINDALYKYGEETLKTTACTSISGQTIK